MSKLPFSELLLRLYRAKEAGSLASTLLNQHPVTVNGTPDAPWKHSVTLPYCMSMVVLALPLFHRGTCEHFHLVVTLYR